MTTGKPDQRQKRRIFKKHFGEILLKNGFSWECGRFVRIHHGEVLIQVSMQLTPGGAAYIHFDALPFCSGNTSFSDQTGKRVDMFQDEWPIPGAKPIGLYTFEDGMFDMQYALFFDHIFQPLNAVEDLVSLLRWQEELERTGIADYLRHPPMLRIMEYILADACEEALRRAMLLEQQIAETMARDVQQEEKELSNTEIEAERLAILRRFAVIHEHNAVRSKEVAQILSYLNQGCTIPLKQQLHENIVRMDSACRKVYPHTYAKQN